MTLLAFQAEAQQLEETLSFNCRSSSLSIRQHHDGLLIRVIDLSHSFSALTKDVMPADRLLAALLRRLQVAQPTEDSARLLSTTASLLITLSNPLNISLLSSQVLVAPALWTRPDGLYTCQQVQGAFRSAAAALVQQETAHQSGKDFNKGHRSAHANWIVSGGIEEGEWARAVIHGADAKSPRWRHLLIISGLLIGFGAPEKGSISPALRHDLEEAFVRASNLALAELRSVESIEAHCITMAMSGTFALLPEPKRLEINHKALLRVSTNAAFFSSEGFQSGYLLRAINKDVMQLGQKFVWPAKSVTVFQTEKMLSRPLVTQMGPLSRLIAHSVEQVDDIRLVHSVAQDLLEFTRALNGQWKQNKLSEVDLSEEREFLSPESLQQTTPMLWKMLRTMMFATVIILQSVVGRTLGDGRLADDRSAPLLASKVLVTLQQLYFISSRLGSSAFTTYNFVSLAAIDILSRYPKESEGFLHEIRPVELGHIPQHPMDRCLDLYFLNVAEHFTIIASSQINEDLIVAAATPYLTSGGNPNLREIFEAAHSVMLAVFTAPQNADLTARLVPFYIDAIFKTFPRNLSPRQFRVALKTLIRISSPPSTLSTAQPDLPGIILELVRHRASTAPSSPLPPIPTHQTIAGSSSAIEPVTVLSEQAVLVMAILDSLPFLFLPILESWLPLAAEAIALIKDPVMAHACRERFWDVISSGEMDLDRAALCVAWWGTRGGREMVFASSNGQQKTGYYMSGALGEQSQI